MGSNPVPNAPWSQKQAQKITQRHNENYASIPTVQMVLLLHGPRQAYRLVADYPVPALTRANEVLVKTKAIGLNPMDWKSCDFNFGIPSLPHISGRELSGDIVHVSQETTTWKLSERVIVISTDYRDLRKAAYQQYVVALHHTLVKLPQSVSYEEGSSIGVAFVSAALALGLCMGVDFSQVHGGPDLFSLMRGLNSARISNDIEAECYKGIQSEERLRTGGWLVIWGGSSTSANLTLQLAKLVGLRVVLVVDAAKHGLRLSNHATIKPDLLVDGYDPERAVDIIRSNTGMKAHFGLDTCGAKTAIHLIQALSPVPDEDVCERSAPQSAPYAPNGIKRCHVVGMAGLPKQCRSSLIAYHELPLKLFHEVQEVGESLTSWLGQLLRVGAIAPPDIFDVEKGLDRINIGLDRMRSGEISGGKLVVRL